MNLTSEVENVMKASDEGNIIRKEGAVDKQIGVSTVNLQPDSNGLVPLSNQAAFAVEKQEELPVSVAQAESLGSLSMPTPETAPTVAPVVEEEKVDIPLNIEMPKMPDEILGQEPTVTNNELFTAATPVEPTATSVTLENPVAEAVVAPTPEAVPVAEPVAEPVVAPVESAPVAEPVVAPVETPVAPIVSEEMPALEALNQAVEAPVADTPVEAPAEPVATPVESVPAAEPVIEDVPVEVPVADTPVEVPVEPTAVEPVETPVDAVVSEETTPAEEKPEISEDEIKKYYDYVDKLIDDFRKEMDEKIEAIKSQINEKIENTNFKKMSDEFVEKTTEILNTPEVSAPAVELPTESVSEVAAPEVPASVLPEIPQVPLENTPAPVVESAPAVELPTLEETIAAAPATPVMEEIPVDTPAQPATPAADPLMQAAMDQIANIEVPASIDSTPIQGKFI